MQFSNDIRIQGKIPADKFKHKLIAVGATLSLPH
jgi:hypothetical protein